MSMPSHEKSELELRDDRFEQYLNSLGIQTGERIDKPATMKRWLTDHAAIAATDELSRFFACPLYRMLKRLDTISVKPDPLGLRNPPQYDPTRGERWLQYCLKARIKGISATWGSDDTKDALGDVIEIIRNKIDDLTDGNFRTDEPEEKYETFAGGFEQIPTFGLFPFYLHKERLRHWHILPFGKLTSVGIAMEKGLARSLIPASLRRLDLTSEITISLDEFAEIARKVEAKDKYKFLYLGGGHAAYRIILNSLEGEKYSWFRMNLDDVHTIMTERPEPESVRVHLRNTSGYRYILVSDLGDPLFSKLRKERNETETALTCLKVRIDDEIPVGIGFSLFMMAKFISMPMLFREISQIILNNLVQNYALIASLEYDGVKLETDYVNMLQLLATPKVTPQSQSIEAEREKKIDQTKDAIRKVLIRTRDQAMRANTSQADEISQEVQQWLDDLDKSDDPGLLEKRLELLGSIKGLPLKALQELRQIFGKQDQVNS